MRIFYYAEPDPKNVHMDPDPKGVKIKEEIVN